MNNSKSFRKFKLKHIIFVDLEMTCWEEHRPKENDGTEKLKEIIDIGVVCVDNVNGKIIDKASYVIKNELSEISDFCTSLTGISQDLIDEEGVSLENASNDIIERFGTLNKTWLAWGCGDYNSMVKNCTIKNVKNPFSDNYINFSEIYSLMRGQTRSGSLKKATILNNIQFNGRQHRALVDAEATAELYIKLFRQN